MRLFLIFIIFLGIGACTNSPIDISQNCGLDSVKHAMQMAQEFPELKEDLAIKLSDGSLTVWELTDIANKYDTLKAEKEKQQIKEIAQKMNQ